jgi:hypothetical protein
VNNFLVAVYLQYLYLLIIVLWHCFIYEKIWGAHTIKSSSGLYISGANGRAVLTLVFHYLHTALLPISTCNSGDPQLQHAVWSRYWICFILCLSPSWPSSLLFLQWFSSSCSNGGPSRDMVTPSSKRRRQTFCLLSGRPGQQPGLLSPKASFAKKAVLSQQRRFNLILVAILEKILDGIMDVVDTVR